MNKQNDVHACEYETHRKSGRASSRFISMGALLALISLIGCAVSPYANTPGVVSMQPTEGRFVKIDGGYMVPYKQQIPGTDVFIEFEPIPGGTFLMDSPEGEDGRKKDEGPQFEVKVEPFWMGKYEVTWDQWLPYEDVAQELRLEMKPPVIPKDRDADAVSFPSPLYEQDYGPIFESLGGQQSPYPAVCMTQITARQYTKWLSKRSRMFFRLPIEAEWEYACRAGTTTAYSYGDDPASLGEYGWFYANSEFEDEERGSPRTDFAGYRAVGIKKPNLWGLYDMHGNVAEWVMDQHLSYSRLEGEIVDAEDTIAWPQQLYGHVARGGSFNSEPEECRSAARDSSTIQWKLHDPEYPQSIWRLTIFHVGMRLVRPLEVSNEPTKSRYWDIDSEEAKKFYQGSYLKSVRAIVEPAEENEKHKHKSQHRNNQDAQ